MIQIIGDTADELSDLQTLIETGKLNYHEEKIKVSATFRLSSGNTLLVDQYNHIIGEKKSEGMKGYKAFDKDLKCKGFQYEIGQTYEMDGDIECCKRGFHFCKDLADCYRFYEMTNNTRICEVEAIGEIKTEDDIKYCTNKIKILSEVENPRIKSNVNTSSLGYCNIGAGNSGNMNCGDYNKGHCNTGSNNTGNRNAGHFNSGHHNSGDRNSGDWNCGDFNVGDWNRGNHNSGVRNCGNYNAGCWNAGHCNSGNHNSGDRNSGYWNSGGDNIGDSNAGYHNAGNHNSGDWNKGNYNVGIFNCKEQKIRIFDKKSNWTMKDWRDSKAYVVMLDCPGYNYYEYDTDQKDNTDKKIPKVPVLRKLEDLNIRQKWWDELSEEDKNAVKSLPNFDTDKFYLCTGIRV